MACGRCGSLLDVMYDWSRLRVPKSLRDFQPKWARRSDPHCFSGVWRFHELLPFVPVEQCVTIGEGPVDLGQFRLDEDKVHVLFQAVPLGKLVG